MKKKSKEKWVKWEPLGDLGNVEYQIKSIKDDVEAFVITLEPVDDYKSDKEKHNIEIKFDGPVDSSRYTDESFYMKAWGKLTEEAESKSCDEEQFFKVENSEYISWLMNVSSPYDDKYGKNIGLRHFSFIDRKSIIDVIVSYDPEVKFVE